MLSSGNEQASYFALFLQPFYDCLRRLLAMSELNKTDVTLMKHLKSRIEEISGLQNHADLSQKDFDFLIYYIEQKTGNRLSLTTIKRIWRNEYHRLPHIATLNMLSELAFDRDWLTLKKEWIENRKPNEASQPEPAQVESIHLKNSYLKPVWITAGLVCIVILAFYWYNYIKRPSSLVAGAIPFSAKVTADGEIPNTVVFSYDVSAIDAPNFFVQQSWDPLRKIEIRKVNTKQTDIYYEPGYHYAKLFAGAEIIKEIPVHIRCKDWFVRLRYPDGEIRKIDSPDLQKEGYLGIKRDQLKEIFTGHVNKIQLGYMLSKDFNVSGDAFHFSSSFRFDSASVNSCPIMTLLIKGDKDYIYVNFGNRGCESNLGLKLGDKVIHGKTSDLSQFGTFIFEWQRMELKVDQKKAWVTLNNKPIFEAGYTKEIGTIKEIDFLFNGVGAIDEIELTDPAGHSRLSEHFNGTLKGGQ